MTLMAAGGVAANNDDEGNNQTGAYRAIASCWVAA
jgi:hypothetical protein